MASVDDDDDNDYDVRECSVHKKQTFQFSIHSLTAWWCYYVYVIFFHIFLVLLLLLFIYIYVRLPAKGCTFRIHTWRDVRERMDASKTEGELLFAAAATTLVLIIAAFSSAFSLKSSSHLPSKIISHMQNSTHV